MSVEDLQSICNSLPHVTESIKWEHDLVFSVGGKMFCVTGIDSIPVSASFKVREEVFEEMSQQPFFRPAPYVARYKWVLCEDINRISSDNLERCLRESYELVFDKLPAKIKTSLGS